MIDFPEFIELMEKMYKASDDSASTRDAFRAFDETEKGIIDSKSLREIITKALDPIPQSEIEDLLASLGLSKDRHISFEGNNKSWKGFIYSWSVSHIPSFFLQCFFTVLKAFKEASESAHDVRTTLLQRYFNV